MLRAGWVFGFVTAGLKRRLPGRYRNSGKESADPLFPRGRAVLAWQWGMGDGYERGMQSANQQA